MEKEVNRKNVVAELGRIALGDEAKIAEKLRALEVLCKLLGLYDQGVQEDPAQITIFEDV